MDHSAVLVKLCRVCGKSVVSKSTKTSYKCEDHLDDLYTVFGVEARLDNPLVHPQHFCHACKTVMYKARTHTQPFQLLLWGGAIMWMTVVVYVHITLARFSVGVDPKK